MRRDVSEMPDDGQTPTRPLSAEPPPGPDTPWVPELDVVAPGAAADSGRAGRRPVQPPDEDVSRDAGAVEPPD